MNVGLKWLRDYVDFDLNAGELARRLTESLTETEVVESPSAAVAGVVAARVVTVEPHPDAEKLTVCVVDWGDGSGPVVCGAPNVRPNMITALAPPGATIAGGRAIGEQTIRGRRSHGMLVSGAELGLAGDAAGILDLEPSTTPGTDVREVLGLDEEVIDLDVQPNRPDCLGIIGVAREVAVAVGSQLRLPPIELREEGGDVAGMAAIELENVTDCPRYIARVVTGLTVGPSPAWLRSRLASVGVRSISNIVDVTNFVMLEYGHPIHAFDYDTLADARIVVRRARAGETLVTLDGVERKLDPSHLLICDGRGPIALAGVMGGGETEVGEGTTNVLLECAWFDPVVVRRGATSLGLRTDASHRFERGVDPDAMPGVAARACALMAELGGGTVARGSLDEGPGRAPERTVTLRLGKLRSMLAPGPPRDGVVAKLEALGFDVAFEGDDGDTLAVRVPSFRSDVTLEADLIEEVARTHGYDAVPPEVPFHPLTASTDTEHAGRNDVRETMIRLGFYEILTSSFMARKAAVDFAGFGLEGEPIELANPVNKETPLLRTSIVPAVLDVVRRNVNVGERDVRVFEIGKAFGRTGDGHSERWMLAGALTGAAERPSWGGAARDVDFFDGKGVLEVLAEALDVDSPESACYDGPILEGRSSARLLIGGRSVGRFGMLASDVAEEWDLPEAVFVFELDLAELGIGNGASRGFAGLSRYPKVRRDLALVVDDGTPAGDVTTEIEGAGEALLAGVEVFDVYRGKQLPAEKKSLGLTLTYMSMERTLTDDEVDAAQKRIVRRLVDRFGASLRE